MDNTQPPTEYREYSVDQPRLSSQRELIPRLYVAIGIIVVLVLAVLFILGVIWLASTQGPTIEALRDIMIIALALESCIFGIVLLILLVMVIRLVNMLEFEIKPILEKTNDTLSTLRGTTYFMTENVVRPVTKVSSYAAGVRRGLSTLFGNPRSNLPK